MIHQPAIGGNGVQRLATDIKIVAGKILKTKERLNKILSGNIGRTVEEIQAATERDNFLSASEALKFGLTNKIITR